MSKEMPSEPTRLNFLAFLKSHRYTRLLAPILAILGITDITRLMRGDTQNPIVLGMVVIAATLAIILAYAKLRSTKLKTASEARHFYPFLRRVAGADREKFVLPRAQQFSALKDFISNLRNDFGIVTGGSGVGKSTLLQEYYRADDTISITLEEPVDYTTSVISELKKIVPRQNLHEFFEIEEDILSDISLADLEGRLARMVTLLPNKDLSILIDQSERLVSTFNELNKRSGVVLVSLLDALRATKNVKVIFAIREDLLYGLLKMVAGHPHKVFFVEGIDKNIDSSFAWRIHRKFEAISVADQTYNRIMSASVKDGGVNTFVVQLCGYLIECTGDGVTQFIGKHYNDYRSVLEKYVCCLCDEYAYLNGDHRLSSEAEIVLFTIAAYNKKTGNHVSLERVIKISHLPRRRVVKCIEYLNARDVVEVHEDWNRALRLAHDVLMDHVISREAKDMRLDHKLAIEQIIDRGIDDLTEIIEETDPLADPIRHVDDGKPPIDGVGTLLLWLAALLYFYRIAFPENSAEILRPINLFLGQLVPGAVYSVDVATAHFIPIAFTQYLWVLFMFGMDRGFFFYIYKHGELNKVLYFTLHIMGFCGAVMGILLSFTPPLFILSIAIPGLMIAFTYLVLAFGAKGNDATIFRYYYELCVTTFLNMTICFATLFAMIKLMDARLGNFQFDMTIVVSVCMLFVYFNYQMRGRQGSRLGRVSMMAIYDAGRNRPDRTSLQS